MSLWTASEAAQATCGKAIGDWVVDGVSIDTRELEQGDLFVALKDIRDGHDFVGNALANGAGAALVSRVPDGVAPDAPLLLVEDVQTALEDLGAAARARTTAKIIAVTGSVGKTGTKEMLRAALSPQGKTHAAVRSFNNHWGVPLTLARMPQDADFAIIEIGMNHPGEIGPLSMLARPDVAVITTVAAVHIAAFENVEGIAREKAAIFEGLDQNGVAVINADLETTAIIQDLADKAGAKSLRFGRADGAEFHLLDAKIIDTVTTIMAQAEGQDVLFKLAAPGTHLAMNALAVLGAVTAAGADMAEAMLALGGFTAPDGRGARQTIHLDPVEGKSIELIDESYNANPTSVAAALEILVAAKPVDGLGRVTKGRRIAVLGDMLELGDAEAQMHSDLAKLGMMDHIDRVLTVGPLMKNLHDALPEDKAGAWFEDADALAAKIHSMIDAGDVIMVKGSNGSKVSRIARALEKLNRD